MAKPILIARVSTTSENIKEILSQTDKVLQTNLKKDYHVLTVFKSKDKDNLEFECLNDSKGLNNGRIEQLIKEYKKLWENLNT